MSDPSTRSEPPATLPGPAAATPWWLPVQRALQRGGLWVMASGLVMLAGVSGSLALLLVGVVGLQGAPLAIVAAGLPTVVLGALLLRSVAHQAPPGASGGELPLDPLTGAVTRGRLLAVAEAEWARGARYGHSVGLLLIEIDRFRQLGERLGADGAQLALRELARGVAQSLRSSDLLARIGETQLAVLLPHADPTGALDVAERIRERGALLPAARTSTTADGAGAVRVSASVGVAVMRPAQQSVVLMFEDAEAALQSARQAGGNCVRAAPWRAERRPLRGPSVGDNQAARGDG